MKHLPAALLAASLALSLPAQAGGPVLIEDATEDGAPAKRLTPGEKIALGILGLVFVGVVLGGGGDCTCYTDDPETPGSCGC